jgi:hypothetical protein
MRGYDNVKQMKFNSQIQKFSSSEILFAVFAWSLLILRFGYRYGTGDQVELLPYTLFLHNPTLYPYDFFIQGLHASVPNERTVMANLLLPFVSHLEITCFVLQFLSTIVLILGLEKLARRFVTNKYLAWLAILVALIPLNDYALGNVELYSECFQASALAVAIVVWAINLFLDKRYFFSSALISLATFIQLLEGLDVMLVFCAVLLIHVIRKETSWKAFFTFISVYAFTAGIYLIFIFVQKSGASSFCKAELFKILFEFRHPHHFIFAAFPKLKMLVFFFVTLVSIVFFASRSRQVVQFLLIGLAGIILYAFAVDGLHNIFISNFQFYKISQWMKFFGVLACFGFLEELLNARFNALMNVKWEAVMLTLGSIVCWLVFVQFHDRLPYSVPLQLFGMKEQDDMISICEKIKETTPADAVFIQPFENTELKFYAQRSSYVEFKANVRNQKYVCDWAERLHEVYSISPGMNIKGFALLDEADNYFFNGLNWEDMNKLKSKGVGYLLTRKDLPTHFGNLVLSNNTYAVYQL